MDKQTKADLIKSLKGIPEDHFKGHTDFKSLTPKEKLIWLSEAAYAVYTISQENPNLRSHKHFKAN